MTYAMIHIPGDCRAPTGRLVPAARKRIMRALTRRWGANPATGACIVGVRDGAVTVACSDFHAGQGYCLHSALEAVTVAALAGGRKVR
jgi:hypothetical protein